MAHEDENGEWVYALRSERCENDGVWSDGGETHRELNMHWLVDVSKRVVRETDHAGDRDEDLRFCEQFVRGIDMNHAPLRDSRSLQTR